MVKDREIFRIALEAVISLWDSRQAVDKKKPSIAESHFQDYLSTLDNLVLKCTDGKRDLRYVLEENPSVSKHADWVRAMKKDIKTVKGDTETGASLIGMLLEDCGCSCPVEP